MNIYEVKYETRYRGSSQVVTEDLKVQVRGDVIRAINKTKKHVLGERIRFEDDNGKTIRTRRVMFKPIAANLVASADI